MENVPTNIPQRMQDIPPKWAHFCLGVEKFITSTLGIDLKGKSIVTGLSGGLDSTALLLVLHYLTRKNGGTLIAVHLNHMLREDAHDDSAWAASLCQSLALPCIIDDVDISKMAQADGCGLEEAGRIARYAFFSDVLQSENADYIAVGHHLDDLGEDVLMRMMRGTGWPALSGMVGYDDRRNLIRPFLLTKKQDLAWFLTDLGVQWREDDSNADLQWTRNRVRHQILPLFLKENPNFLESVTRLWKLGRIDRSYWAETVDVTEPILSNDQLKDSHQALRLRLYKNACDLVGEGQVLADTLFKLDQAWAEKRVGTTFQLPGNKVVKITSSGVVFTCEH